MNEKNEGRWLSAAMISPVIQASSNCSWVAALVTGFLCLIILCGMEKLEVGSTRSRWIGAVQWLWMLLVLSEFLHWTMLNWPNYRNYHVVPLVILALALHSLGKGKGRAANVAVILLRVMVLLLGAVLISGIREVHWVNLEPQWKMQTANYIVVLLIPAMVMGKTLRKGKWQMPLLGLVVSVITSGVLSLHFIARCDAPFYEMSRNVSLLGIGNRYESLAATGLTMGYFVLMTLLLQVTADAWEQNRKAKHGLWISGVFAGLVFLSGMRINSRLLAMGTLIVWVAMPILEKGALRMKMRSNKDI